MEKFYQLQKKANNDNNYSVRKMFDIIDSIFKLYNASEELSDKEYRVKVKELIETVKTALN